MVGLISFLIIVVSVLLVAVVMIQNSKGGGLDSSLASKNQFLGAGKTTEVVEKVTWWLVGILIFLCVVNTKMISVGNSNFNEVEEVIDETNEVEGDSEDVDFE